MKPENTGTGLVVGQFGLGVADSADADMEPEVIPLAGTITFTPSVPYLPNPTAAPNPITIVTSPITAVLDNEGFLCTPGPDGTTPYYRGIRLFATDDPDLSVLDWTWSVVYTFQAVRGITPRIPAHAMALLEGETRDLATVVPVPSSPGIGTPQALALLAQAVAAAGTVADAHLLMERAEEAADRAEAPTDLMMANTAADPLSLFSGEIAGVIDQRAPEAVETVMGPVVGSLVAAAIADDPTVVNAAAAAVDANPKIATLSGVRLANDAVLDVAMSRTDAYTESDAYADTVRGFPVNRAGRLMNLPFNNSGTHAAQQYFPFRHPGFFLRYIYSGAPYTGAPYGAANKGWQEFRNWADTLAALNLKADKSSVVVVPERSDPAQWAAVGDSLTDGYSNATRWDEVDSFPSKLQAALPAGTTVINYGQSGATSDQINMLLGITAFQLRVPGGTIPASGAVDLTTEQAIGGWTDVQDLTFPGHLEGIYGSLKRTSGAWTFTRAASGTALARTYGSFRSYYAAMPTLAGIAGHSLIVGYGRNDIAKNTTGMEATIPDHVIRAYTDAHAFMTPRNKQFIFAGTISRTDETPDSAGFLMVQEIRERLRQLFPSNFVDLQGYLTGAQVWTHTGITPTTADLNAQLQGMTPPSLFDDVTHYNRATAKAIGENLYAPYIRKKGWA